MTLQAVPDYGINVPDASKAFEEGMMWRQQYNQQQAARIEGEEIKKAITGLGPNPSVQSINALVVKYPALAERFKKPLEILSDEERQTKQGQAIPIYAAMQNGKPEIAISLLQQQANALRNSGNEKGARDAEAQINLIKADPNSATTAFGVTLASIMGPDNFQKTFGELREQQLQPEKVAAAKAKAKSLAESGGIEVSQVKYWPNGVTMVIGKNNEQMVRDASGRVLTGANATAAVQSGMDADIRLAGGRAGAAAAAEAGVRASTEPSIAADIDAAKAAIVIGTEAFKKISPIRKNISNYDEAIRLIEKEGANTGVIASRLPSLFASSIELDNLGQTMGVESLAGGGFGTLSDSDVRLSIQRALPKGLEGPELVVWLKKKKAADLKYISELERAAKFMQKGRTLADFLDANGNQASAPAAVAPANDMAAAAAAELARRRGGG